MMRFFKLLALLILLITGVESFAPNPLFRKRSISTTSIRPIGSTTRLHEYYGDSFSTPVSTYSTWCLSGGWTTSFSTAKNVTGRNYAVSGMGVTYECGQYYANATFPHFQSTSIMVGLNDIRNADNAANNAMVIGGVSSMISLHYGKRFYSFNEFATKVGTWSSGTTIYTRSSAYATSSTVGNTATQVFEGDAIAVLTSVHNDNRRGFTVHVDGVLKSTFDGSGLCNTTLGQLVSGSYFSPYAIVIDGLGSGTHTCVITVTSGSGTGGVVLDGLVELAPSNSPWLKPLVWLEIPHMRDNAYNTGSPYNQATEAGINTLNNAVWTSSQFTVFKSRYANFGRFQTNSYYEPNDPAQVDSDGIHPNCTGKTNISNGVGQLLSSYVTAPTHSVVSNWNQSWSGSAPSASVITSLNDFITGLSDCSCLNNHDILCVIGGLESDEHRLKPILTSGVSPIVNNGTTLNSSGSTGNGSNQYLNYKWKPLSHGVNFTQNDALIYSYNNSGNNSSGFDFGSWDGVSGASGKGLLLQVASSSIAGALNSGLYSFNTTISGAVGFYGMKRSGSTSSYVFKNTSIITTSSASSTTRNDLEVYGNALNNAGSPGFYSPHQIGLFGAGSSSINEVIVAGLWYDYKKERGF